MLLSLADWLARLLGGTSLRIGVRAKQEIFSQRTKPLHQALHILPADLLGVAVLQLTKRGVGFNNRRVDPKMTPLEQLV